ncbi:hypothetical protein AB0N09_07010 [Streptomyces erythrochromogenes]
MNTTRPMSAAVPAPSALLAPLPTRPAGSGPGTCPLTHLDKEIAS